MTCANAAPSGGVTGVPREIVSVRPFTRNSVPSVVTNDGTRSSTRDDTVHHADQAGREQADQQREP